MRYEAVREMYLHHWTYSGAKDEAKVHEMYHDDAILEFPQSGERFRGKANMQGFREKYPARVTFEPREIRGSGDTWIGEGRAFYNEANPIVFVHILEFRGDLVQRETIYFAEPFPAPDWRKPWAEQNAAWEPQTDLPTRVPSGS